MLKNQYIPVGFIFSKEASKYCYNLFVAVVLLKFSIISASPLVPDTSVAVRTQAAN